MRQVASLVPNVPDRTVLDGRQRVVGRVIAVRSHPRGASASVLVVRLTEEARRSLGAPTDEAEIPVRYVCAVRPFEVSLDRPLELMRRRPRQRARGAAEPPA